MALLGELVIAVRGADRVHAYAYDVSKHMYY